MISVSTLTTSVHTTLTAGNPALDGLFFNGVDATCVVLKGFCPPGMTGGEVE